MPGIWHKTFLNISKYLFGKTRNISESWHKNFIDAHLQTLPALRKLTYSILVKDHRSPLPCCHAFFFFPLSLYDFKTRKYHCSVCKRKWLVFLIVFCFQKPYCEPVAQKVLQKRSVCTWIFLLQSTRNLTVNVLMKKTILLQLLYLLAEPLKRFPS